MKKSIIALLVFSASIFESNAQEKTYWQQEVNYTIAAILNDKEHSIKANMHFEYINHSPDTLQFIWLHIWPNAYKNNETALYKQVGADKEGKKRLKAFKEKGFIDSMSFTINGKPAAVQPHPQHIDIIKLPLEEALLPGGKITVATPFYVKLPGYFSRLGHSDNYYMISQWYPKPAVYDAKGWHEMPYLDQGEFYSEFGSFDVSITLPSAYIVAATGNLQNSTELAAYKTTGAANRKMYDQSIAGITEAESIKNILKKIKPERVNITDASVTKTLQFTEKKIHDFAWFASKDFVVQYDTLRLASGVITEAFAFHDVKSGDQWYNASNFVEDAVLKYSNWLGEYPYATVKAVEGPKNQSSGGMEYPTVTMITSPDADQKRLDAVITHEVGHNWLYGILASNERDFPWMDEGINTYLQFRYEAEKYRANSIFGNAIPEELKKNSSDEFLAIIYNIMNQQIPMEEPIGTNSVDFSSKENYGTVVYIKTAVWMYTLEIVIGRQKTDDALRAYFDQWKFKHPYPEDFQKTVTETANYNLDDFFSLLNKKGKISN
jgi:hypothetical protein